MINDENDEGSSLPDEDAAWDRGRACVWRKEKKKKSAAAVQGRSSGPSSVARCCRDKKKRDDRWWESTGLVTVASYGRRHHLAEEVPGLYIRRLTLEDPRRREPSGSRPQSPARHICHPRSGYAPSARGSSRYRSGSSDLTLTRPGVPPTNLRPDSLTVAPRFDSRAMIDKLEISAPLTPPPARRIIIRACN